MEEKYLIEGLRNKDKVVFDFIFNYYYSGLCAYSLKYVPKKEVVEDIVQDFFVSLWLKDNRADISSSLKSYLFTSVKNRCLDYLKHNKVEEKFNLFAMHKTIGLADSSYDMYVETELQEAVTSALEKLSPRCREIIEMSRFQGLKNQEIADKLNISKRTVELQISIALKILRTELKGFLPAWMLVLLLR